MISELQHILNLCIYAKTKGHDVFFNYSPHVNMVTVDIHLNGWKEEAKAYKAFYFSLEDAIKIQITEAYLEGLCA